jgi:hypothetical protein
VVFQQSIRNRKVCGPLITAFYSFREAVQIRL